MRKIVSIAGLIGIAIAAAPPVALAEIIFSNDKLTLAFAEPEQGMGLLRVENKPAGTVFLNTAETGPLLWQYCFSRPGSNDEPLAWVSNREAGSCRFRQEGERLILNWDDVPVLDVPAVFSVELTLEWQPDGSVELRIRPTLHTEEFTFKEQLFPSRGSALDAAEEKMLFPRGNLGSRYTDEPIVGLYPGCESQLQFAGFFKKNQPGGLYFGFHDPTASRKFFSLNPQYGFDVVTYAEDATVPGQSRFPEFPVVVAATDTPWTATARYRDWALRQRWTAKGKLAGRTDIPAAARQIDLWFNMFGKPAAVRMNFLAEPAVGRDNVAIHWYNWNIHPFDTHYPDFFPARQEFSETVAEIQRNGHWVVPYINGRLWDTALPDFEDNGRAGVAMRPDGSLTIEDYGSGATLAAMCPTSPAYRRKLMAAFETLVEQYGVHGVYIDQIGAAAPVLCYNPAHGHPLGGGGWWQEAYRQMLQPIAERYGDRVLIATENGAEPYIDTISSFLLWMAVYPDDFPSLPAVYGQYAWYFCSPATELDSDESFAALMSRSLLWGIQPGWLPWLHGSGKRDGFHEKRRAYIDQIVALRKHGRTYLQDGELVDEIVFAEPIGKVPVEFKRNAQYGGTSFPGEYPACYGALWRRADGAGLAAAVANVSGQTIGNRFVLPVAEYALEAGKLKLSRLNADGSRSDWPMTDGTVEFQLAPFELAVFVLE